MSATTASNGMSSERSGSFWCGSAFLLSMLYAFAAGTSPGFLSGKLAPGGGFNQVDDTDPIATYRYLATELGRRSIAYLHVGNYGIEWDVFGTIRPLFDGPMIYNVGFNRASATSAVEKNGADMVALGQAFIANPDLVERYRNGWTVNRPRVATYYSQGRSEEHTLNSSN